MSCCIHGVLPGYGAHAHKAPAIINGIYSETASEAKFRLQSLYFAPEVAEQGKRLQVYPVMLAAMLDATYFIERVVVEYRFPL